MSETCTIASGDKWKIEKDRASEWRWNRTARNGQIVGAATEGYVNKSDCIANAQRNGMTCTPS